MIDEIYQMIDEIYHLIPIEGMCFLLRSKTADSTSGNL
jgi:hypothetical protein